MQLHIAMVLVVIAFALGYWVGGHPAIARARAAEFEAAVVARLKALAKTIADHNEGKPPGTT